MTWLDIFLELFNSFYSSCDSRVGNKGGLAHYQKA